MSTQSAVLFPREARIHVGLAVKNLRRSVEFYRTLFGQGPVKIRPGYAKFEIEEPSLNLAVNEHPHPTPMALPAHFGIQVKSSARVAEMARRYHDQGLETRIAFNETCCYAVQNKVWVTDPDGNAWEVFVVLDDQPTGKKDEGAVACCDPACCTD